MHVMANCCVMIDGTDSVYMYLHLYHTHTCYHTLRINNNLRSTSSIIIIIRHDLVTGDISAIGGVKGLAFCLAVAPDF